MGRRFLPVEQASFCKQERTDANRSHAAHHRREPLQPSKECWVTNVACSKTANEQQCIEVLLQTLVVCFCNKREHATFALDFQSFAAGCDFNTVNCLARQPVCGAEDLN